MPDTPRIGVALGGAGAKGLCHIPFLQVLEDLGVRPAVMSGTSIGAIIGGLYAAGRSAQEIAGIARDLHLGHAFQMVEFGSPKGSDQKAKGFMKLLGQVLPATRFEELQIPLKVVATDFWARSQVVLDSGDLRLAIRASMALPGAFPPVIDGDRLLIDGGSVNPVPFDVIRDDCDILIAINVLGSKEPAKGRKIPSDAEIMFSTFQIAETALVEEKMKSAQVDIYLKPKLRNIRVLEFYKQEEIMASVSDDVVVLRRNLEERLSQG